MKRIFIITCIALMIFSIVPDAAFAADSVGDESGLVAALTGTGGDYTLSRDIVLNNACTVLTGSLVNLDLAGYKISLNAAVTVSGELNISGTGTIERGTITGNLISVLSGGELSLSGSTLNGNGGLVSAAASAVSVGAGGSFVMSSGVITNNKISSANANGGGVTVQGTFRMNGGTISENLSCRGGGVHVDGGTFNMYGGSIENNNTQRLSGSGGLGGGVYVSGNGTFNMYDDSEVKNNITGKDGGGVGVNYGTFNLYDGIVLGNSSSYPVPSNVLELNGSNGGGVWTSSNSSVISHFNMEGGSVSGNSAVYGAGIQVNCPATTSTISGGSVTSNSAYGFGGGVHADYGANLEISGSTVISGNTASAGGGVAAYGKSDSLHSKITIGSGVSITGNSANGGEGGGVYLPIYATVTVNGASITGNSTDNYGGGVYVGYLNAYFTMTSGKLYGNTAELGAADLASTFMSTVSLPDAASMGYDLNIVDNWYYDYNGDRFATTASPLVAPNTHVPLDPNGVMDIIAAATHTLNYNANGGSGTVPDTVEDKQTGITAVVGDDSGISYVEHVFTGWNTASDGSGTAYAPGDTFTFTEDTTLYAQWVPLYTLQYNANGATGSVPSSLTDQLSGTTIIIEDSSGLSYQYYEFTGWNTAADGSGISYAAGASLVLDSDITLYAQWTAQPVIYSNIDDGTIYTDGRINLWPNIPGGTWSWNESYLSLIKTSDDTLTFKGLKAGKVTVTYTVGGKSADYIVIIKASILPSTGQNKALLYMFIGLDIILIIAFTIKLLTKETF